MEAYIGIHAADPDVHHWQSHGLTGPDHTLAGLTTGHVLTATSATAAAFQALRAAAVARLAYAAPITGLWMSTYPMTASAAWASRPG